MTDVFPPFDSDEQVDSDEPAKKRHRAFRLKSGDVPIRMLIPNLVTLMGLVAGLTAIRMAIEHRWELAIMCIIFAAILDALDGRIARLLNAATRFGAELDSLADFVNFGVAPAVIIFAWALGPLKSLGWIVVLVFALCTVLRLARFNIALDAPDEPHWKANYFVGVPAPAGAILVLLPLYLELLGVQGIKLVTPLILLYTLAIAFLLVSHVPTFSGKLAGEKIKRVYVAPLFLLFGLLAAILFTYPYATLVAGSFIYLLVIPISVRRFRRKEELEDLDDDKLDVAAE